MKLLSVDGMFHDGKIELSDMPFGIDRARVIVTFLEPQNPAPISQTMKLGMFAQVTQKFSGPFSGCFIPSRTVEMRLDSLEFRPRQ